MEIPDYQQMMLPVLRCVEDGKDHHIRDITTYVMDHFGLSQPQRSLLLPSGQQTVAGNRVSWAKTYLKMAGLLESPRRGVFKITDAGRMVLRRNLSSIDAAFLREYPSFVEFMSRSATMTGDKDDEKVESTSSSTPQEQISAAYGVLRQSLAKELLERVKASTPAFFEELVVRLLVAMGYGGTLADAGSRIGRSGDGGIDGVIKEDRLGLDVVCIQAKRWESTVGRPVVQSFVGSMVGYRASKGVLITTSTFSSEALEYINLIESKKVVLIDGQKLTEYMIDYNIGVSAAETYVVKKVDYDFFEEDAD